MADEFSHVEDGELVVNLHADQVAAWESDARIVAIIAGSQSGKTCFGPVWLEREIRRRGPGDYLVASPTYKLLRRKAEPEFLRLFEQQLRLGSYHRSDYIFTVQPAGEVWLFGGPQEQTTRVFFGYAEDPESLESATAKAAWLDEAGQKKFKLGSHEAIQRRLALHEGRELITTTPYDLGWLYQKIYRPWRAGAEDIDVISFESTANPAFPRDEWERQRRALPRWKFDLFYRGVFTRPAGLIYDNFDLERDVIPRFEIPERWNRYIGLDFGAVNTAAVFYAEDPDTRRLVAYREYHAGERTARAHVRELLGEGPAPTLVAGGSKSERQWRREFRAAGLDIRSPRVHEVEVGIDRVYGFHARGEVLVFDDLTGYLEQKQTYARETDEAGEPTERIAEKATFHLMDAERYILTLLHEVRTGGARTAFVPT